MIATQVEGMGVTAGAMALLCSQVEREPSPTICNIEEIGHCAFGPDGRVVGAEHVGS